MNDYLAFTLDKFTFKVATDRYYNSEGVWAKADAGRITVGVSDFFQQHNGDIAFAEVAAVGTAVSAGDGFADIETIKVDIEIPCPVSGVITAVNDRLELEAELINQSPYEDGWLAVIETADWDADRARLMTPEAYLTVMQVQALEESPG